MTTPKPDPAVEAAKSVSNLFRPYTEADMKIAIRAAYAEHMKAADEMAKAAELLMPLGRQLLGLKSEHVGPWQNAYEATFKALARWREINPEVEE